MRDMDSFDPIAYREQQYHRLIKYLNLAAERHAGCRPHASDEVFLQQARELSYCKNSLDLSERDYILFLDFAFFKALKALYTRDLLIQEKGIFSMMNLPFGQESLHSEELEGNFDQISVASQARQKLQAQCNGLRDTLVQIEAKVKDFQDRKLIDAERNGPAYQAFEQLNKAIFSHIEVYEAEQNKQINLTGALSSELMGQCKADCQKAIQVAALILNQHRGWGLVLEKILGAVRDFFVGRPKSANKECLVMFKTQSALRLQSLERDLAKQL
jgi:hypothetical protein